MKKHVLPTDSASYSNLIVHAARKCGCAAVVVRRVGRGTLLLPGVNEPPDAAPKAERGPVLQQGRLSHPLVVHPHLRARAARGHCTNRRIFYKAFSHAILGTYWNIQKGPFGHFLYFLSSKWLEKSKLCTPNLFKNTHFRGRSITF